MQVNILNDSATPMPSPMLYSPLYLSSCPNQSAMPWYALGKYVGPIRWFHFVACLIISLFVYFVIEICQQNSRQKASQITDKRASQITGKRTNQIADKSETSRTTDQ